MGIEELRKLLKKSNNKFSIFNDENIFNKYVCTIQEVLDLLKDFFSNAEILKLFEFPPFQNLKTINRLAIMTIITDSEVMLKMLKNDIIMREIEDYQIVDLIQTKLSDDCKKQILYDRELCEKRGLTAYDYEKIISSMSVQNIGEILEDTELVTKAVKLENYQIFELIQVLPDEDKKYKLAIEYNLPMYYLTELIKTFKAAKKTEIILEKDAFSVYDIILGENVSLNVKDILVSYDVEELKEFLSQNKQFCEDRHIYPYSIVSKMDVSRQVEFASRLQEMDLTLVEKQEVLAMLSEEAKEEIDSSEFPKELKNAISMQRNKFGDRIKIDFERDLEDYRGLDRVISVNPTEFTDEKRKKFIELCHICPNMAVYNLINDIASFYSTTKEYIEGEEWISSVLDKLEPTYSKLQKIAVIDNAIGKKISYSPDFATEVFNSNNCRAIWRIISSGYGICNGIASLEQYMFNRVGIESKLVSSGNHSFLKLDDIELPLENGEIVKGNTILDPTWNLVLHRFEGKPSHFCINYEQARASDIDPKGKDRKCHKNDEQLKNATLSLDTPSLRKLFASVGLANKEGKFPVKETIELSKAIHQTFANNPSENINKQFLLLAKVCPEFAKCQNESMKFLSDIFLDDENLQYNRCVVNRVYDRADAERRPIMYVYIDSAELGKRFYFADKEEGRFIELSPEEFTKRFECYDKDLEETKGIRPWEEAQEQIKEDKVSQTPNEIAKAGEGTDR